MSKITEMGQRCEEIAKYLEKLRNQKGDLSNQIVSLENDVTKLDQQMEILSKKRASMVGTLEHKQRLLGTLDRTITEAETTYTKITESSQTLLAFMKKEAFEVERNLKSDGSV